LNLYPEIDESGDGRSKMILLQTPGILSIAQLDGAPRGQLEFNGRLFVIAGTKLYEIVMLSPSSGIIPIIIQANVLGTVANDGLPASLAANQFQLLMCSAGNVYLLNLATNAFSQVAASNFTLSTGPAPVIQVAFCDSFFLALIKNSQTVQISNVLDGANWNLNGQIVVSVYPENVVGMIVDHRELGLIGRKKSQIYFASGSANVFDAQPGGLIEQGGAATFAINQLDNSVFWLGADEKGSLVGWRLNGYTPVRVSTFATELAWQKYPKSSDAVSYAYQDGGHSFWVILFPSANNGNGATWSYDTASGLWHERDFLNVTSGASMGHPSWNHSFAFGSHIVGDWRSANLYQMSLQFFDNAGVPITRVRRAPHISTELETVRHSRFELDMETGLSAVGTTPVVLASPNGTLWQITITDDGLLHTAAGPGGVTPVILTDATNAATWQVGVNNAGLLTTTSIALDPIQPKVIPFVSPTKATAWNLQVTVGGLLQTVKITTGLPTLSLNGGLGPLVWLRWSDDGGHSWSSPQSRSAGAPGEYKTRVVWRRLGRARVRTYEVSCSEPVPVRFVDAYVNATPGFGPSERLPHTLRKVA
jgi:hypothetical protein